MDAVKPRSQRLHMSSSGCQKIDHGKVVVPNSSTSVRKQVIKFGSVCIWSLKFDEALFQALPFAAVHYRDEGCSGKKMIA